ncbi:MAG: UvrD-helicase domain-containing protein, partial [Alphaproteobacteria bacterium]
MTSPASLEAGIAQRRAAAPESSVWVSASAGTGKTKVLTDRVLALLLDGAAPHRILCLTFTRAAAAEMSNRINRHLGNWAACTEGELAERIENITGAPPDAKIRAHARTLFARVLDVPDSMKINTIHAFCESLLRRFPLEAGVAPHFQLIDERTAAEALHAARDTVLSDARRGDDAALADSLREVAGWVNEDDFAKVLSQLASERDRLRRVIDAHDGIAGLATALFGVLGVAE